MVVNVPSRQLFIGGEWKEALLKNRIPIINPSTQEKIGDIPAATAEDVEVAVATARKALVRSKGQEWASASGSVRAKYLQAIAAKISERKSELAKLEAIDRGKPLDEAAWDIDDVSGCFEYYADLAEGPDAKQKAPVSIPMETFKSYILKEPIGVVGLITPWNYPLLMTAWKVAPALAAGCTAILKPSELASVTCLELGEICQEVGLPPGVLNILPGLGPEAGAPLAAHPNVDKVAFTGSSATGKKVVAAAAEVIKVIVDRYDRSCDDGTGWTIFGCFWTNGQICSATSRLLVHVSIASEFLEKLVKWSKNIKVSDPLEDGCRLGPIVSEGQHLSKGFFLEPTIITEVTPDMEIWKEEVFGPVLSVKTFRTEEAAIELANDTHYGLGAAVLSNDLERCERVTKAFQAGIV